VAKVNQEKKEKNPEKENSRRGVVNGAGGIL
jgi:hypothetical protein